MKNVNKTNANCICEMDWLLLESPVAKLASHEFANSASCTAPDSAPPPPCSSAVPVGFGDESVADFRLHNSIFQPIKLIPPFVSTQH